MCQRLSRWVAFWTNLADGFGKQLEKDHARLQSEQIESIVWEICFRKYEYSLWMKILNKNTLPKKFRKFFFEKFWLILQVDYWSVRDE